MARVKSLNQKRGKPLALPSEAFPGPMGAPGGGAPWLAEPRVFPRFSGQSLLSEPDALAAVLVHRIFRFLECILNRITDIIGVGIVVAGNKAQSRKNEEQWKDKQFFHYWIRLDSSLIFRWTPGAPDQQGCVARRVPSTQNQCKRQTSRG